MHQAPVCCVMAVYTMKLKLLYLFKSNGLKYFMCHKKIKYEKQSMISTNACVHWILLKQLLTNVETELCGLFL